ncbi:MAG: sigma-54-dependent transcriptional regulator, partial [Candidatus Binatia bacterium]
MKPILLIVEDDDGIRISLEKSFLRRDYKVFGTSGVSGANRIMSEQKIDIILLDLRLTDGSGFDVLKTARDLDKEIVVIIMTAFPEVKTAVRAMKAGARDFVIKPFELEELHLAVERAMETRTLRRNVRLLERERRRISDISEILGKSPAIDYVRELIFKVAVTDAPVLVTGETGTGKELVADAIHRLSPRSGGPLVKVNCSALSEELLQSELFGHEKGSFTDAKQARSGLFEMADNGTLFLDEISEMNASLQAKLLRVVEGHPFRRVGGQREIQTNVRLIAATNRDLSMSLRSGIFREDLFFRLNRFQINVPPLRSRGGDIILLARFFIQDSAKALRKGSILLTPEVEDVLIAY